MDAPAATITPHGVGSLSLVALALAQLAADADDNAPARRSTRPALVRRTRTARRSGR